MISIFKDPVTIKGVTGSVMMGFAEIIYSEIGPIIGVASAVLGLYLVIISIKQKRREMAAWEKNQNIQNGKNNHSPH